MMKQAHEGSETVKRGTSCWRESRGGIKVVHLGCQGLNYLEVPYVAAEVDLAGRGL